MQRITVSLCTPAVLDALGEVALNDVFATTSAVTIEHSGNGISTPTDML